MAVEPAVQLDHARLMLLYAEIALASGQTSWLETHLPMSTAAAGAAGGQDLALQVRLRLMVADTTGEWADLLRDARPAEPRPGTGRARPCRNARYRATDGDYQKADEGWLEAV